jgi:outer membrane protein TolC
MKMYKISKLIVLICLSFGLKAQDLSLEKLIEIGIKNNKDIEASIKKIDLQKTLINTAYEVPKTNIELQVGSIQNPGIVDYSLSAAQFFELPKVYQLKKQYQQALVSESEAYSKLAITDLKYRISLAYFELGYFERLKGLYKQETSKLYDLEKVYQRRFEEGESDLANVLAIGLKIKEFGIKIKTLEQLEEEQKSKLKVLTFTTSLPQLSFIDADFSKTIASSKISNSRLEILNSQVITAENNMLVEKSKLMPSLKLGAINQSMFGYRNQFIGIAGVEIPIFRKAMQARVDGAKIQKDILETEYVSLENQIKNEVDLTLKWIASDREKVSELETEILPKSETLMDISNKKYKAGAIEYLDWYLYYNQFLGYKTEQIQLLRDLNQRVSLLKFLTENE